MNIRDDYLWISLVAMKSSFAQLSFPVNAMPWLAIVMAIRRTSCRRNIIMRGGIVSGSPSEIN